MSEVTARASKGFEEVHREFADRCLHEICKSTAVQEALFALRSLIGVLSADKPSLSASDTNTVLSLCLLERIITEIMHAPSLEMLEIVEREHAGKLYELMVGRSQHMRFQSSVATFGMRVLGATRARLYYEKCASKRPEQLLRCVSDVELALMSPDLRDPVVVDKPSAPNPWAFARRPFTPARRHNATKLPRDAVPSVNADTPLDSGNSTEPEIEVGEPLCSVCLADVGGSQPGCALAAAAAAAESPAAPTAAAEPAYSEE